METTHQPKKTMASNSQKLDTLIDKAIQKVSGKREKDICRYLPAKAGGYIHHFTLKKMKTVGSDELADMIERFILGVEQPKTVKPKQRAARGSRKKKDQVFFTKSELERMLEHAKAANDKDIVRKLTPMKDLKSIKRELISSIRHNRVEDDLWVSYVEALVHTQQMLGGLSPEDAADMMEDDED
ncbi:MAG: hypothetical protein K0S07_727 [Chlamydiales bacterium]|jgi:hypothetical protein|nr:hypothetical protein [Chlamydiales bacterium]